MIPAICLLFRKCLEVVTQVGLGICVSFIYQPYVYVLGPVRGAGGTIMHDTALIFSEAQCSYLGAGQRDPRGGRTWCQQKEELLLGHENGSKYHLLTGG